MTAPLTSEDVAKIKAHAEKRSGMLIGARERPLVEQILRLLAEVERLTAENEDLRRHAPSDRDWQAMRAALGGDPTKR